MSPRVLGLQFHHNHFFLRIQCLHIILYNHLPLPLSSLEPTPAAPGVPKRSPIQEPPRPKVRLATVNSKWVNSIDPFWNLWALLNIAIMMLISFFFAVIGKSSEIKLSTTTSWKWNFALSVSLDSFQLQAIVREERKSNQKWKQNLIQKCPSWKL